MQFRIDSQTVLRPYPGHKMRATKRPRFLGRLDAQCRGDAPLPRSFFDGCQETARCAITLHGATSVPTQGRDTSGGSAAVPECRGASAVVVGAMCAVLHFLRPVLCTVVSWACQVSVGTNAHRAPCAAQCSRALVESVRPPFDSAIWPFRAKPFLSLVCGTPPSDLKRWCTRGSWPFVVADRCRRCGPLLLQETMDFF